MISKELTVALRFADTFAPSEGTIQAHIDVINDQGYVWYGKLGSPVSDKVVASVLANDSPRILLIHSGRTGRYWAYIEKIQRTIPPRSGIPSYYRDTAGSFKTWFKITRIEEASKSILSECVVASSQRPLSEVSKSSMSPYFIIEVNKK